MGARLMLGFIWCLITNTACAGGKVSDIDGAPIQTDWTVPKNNEVNLSVIKKFHLNELPLEGGGFTGKLFLLTERSQVLGFTERHSHLRGLFASTIRQPTKILLLDATMS